MAVILFTGLWFWTAFFFPTGIHERYIAYCMPFVILAAMKIPKFWISVVILAIVGSAEMTHNIWLDTETPPYKYAIEAQRMKYYYQSIPFSKRPPRYVLDQELSRLHKLIEEHRRKDRPFEYLAVLTCIAGYFWGMVIPFVGFSNKKPQVSAVKKPRHPKRRG